MRIMIKDSSTDSLDGVLLENFTVEDLDIPTVEAYRQRLKQLNPTHPFVELEQIGFLKKIRVLRINRKTKILELSLGGLLLFGKSEVIKERVYHYHVEYIDKSNPLIERWSDRLIYDGTWEDNIYTFFFKAINKINGSVPKSFKMMDDNITREELNEVHVALREILVNSIIHANFDVSQPIKITKYQNYYQFENPGTLRISQEEFFAGEHSDPRNQIIQEAFRLLNLCERAGTGIPKVLKAVKDNDYKYPDIEEKDGKFIFRFWTIDRATINKEKIESSQKIDGLEKKILSFLVKNTYITNKIIQQEFKISKLKANRILNKLISENFIKREGQGRGTKYKLL
jgi:predicted HTH transcriptional regulator